MMPLHRSPIAVVFVGVIFAAAVLSTAQEAPVSKGVLVSVGLTPIEALRAATSVPADKFNLARRGWIRPGAIADLLLVDGDPTVEIKATRRIAAVRDSGVFTLFIDDIRLR